MTRWLKIGTVIRRREVSPGTHSSLPQNDCGCHSLLSLFICCGPFAHCFVQISSNTLLRKLSHGSSLTCPKFTQLGSIVLDSVLCLAEPKLLLLATVKALLFHIRRDEVISLKWGMDKQIPYIHAKESDSAIEKEQVNDTVWWVSSASC